MSELWPDDIPAHWMVCFAVADVDATATRAEQLGGRTAVSPHDRPNLGRVAVLTDPEGGLFSVLERS